MMPRVHAQAVSAIARLGFATLLAFAVLAATYQATANAQTGADPDFWKQTGERMATVTSLIYRQSPQAIPPSSEVVAEEAARLRAAQATLPPTNPQAPSLWHQIRGVTVKSGLSTPLRALGTVGLAAGTLELGWKIGTGINAKFLRIGIPGDGEPPSTYSSPEIHFRAQGQLSQLWYQIPAPEDAWVWSIFSSAFSYQRSMEYRGPGTTNCASQIFTPPPEFTEVAIPMGCGGGPGDLRIAYLPENDLAAPGPIEDYTGQPYDRWSGAPAAPPQTTVEQAILNELEKPAKELLRQWLNYTLGSPGEEDPVGIGQPNPEIEFPGFVEHWEEHGDEFTPAYDDPAEYWRDAADIVERWGNSDPDVLKCDRLSDGAQIYWDSVRRAIVIVKDGKIVTFFKPPGPPPADFDYWFAQCSS